MLVLKYPSHPAAGVTYTQKVQALSPIAYWPLNETSGTAITDASGNGRNGTYNGPTLGQPGIGDGNTAPLFDGVNDAANVYSASLASAFNGAEGTVAVWAKVASSAVWTDATYRAIVRLAVDSNNDIMIYRSTVSNRINCDYRAGGTLNQVAATSLTSTAWLHIALTWSKTSNVLTAYSNGASIGTQPVTGTWAGSLASTRTLLGSQFAPSTMPWSGYLAHAAIWTTALSSTDIASLATV